MLSVSCRQRPRARWMVFCKCESPFPATLGRFSRSFRHAQPRCHFSPTPPTPAQGKKGTPRPCGVEAVLALQRRILGLKRPPVLRHMLNLGRGASNAGASWDGPGLRKPAESGPSRGRHPGPESVAPSVCSAGRRNGQRCPIFSGTQSFFAPHEPSATPGREMETHIPPPPWVIQDSPSVEPEGLSPTLAELLLLEQSSPMHTPGVSSPAGIWGHGVW